MESRIQRRTDLGSAAVPPDAVCRGARDALYSQASFDAVVNKNISLVQDIDRIGTTGPEATLGATDWLLNGLNLSASATYTDTKIKANAGFVTTPVTPSAVGSPTSRAGVGRCWPPIASTITGAPDWLAATAAASTAR